MERIDDRFFDPCVKMLTATGKAELNHGTLSIKQEDVLQSFTETYSDWIVIAIFDT